MEERSLCIQPASETRQGNGRKTVSRAGAWTRAAVICARVASRPSSPDSVSGLLPPDVHHSVKEAARLIALVADSDWPRRGSTSLELPTVDVPVENPVGGGKRKTKKGGIASSSEISAPTRRSQAVLDLLSTTDVGMRVPSPATEDALIGASDWELRESKCCDGEAGSRVGGC